MEFAELTPDTWDDFAPAGKEVDCIYGDFVLRNEHLIAVIARLADGKYDLAVEAFGRPSKQLVVDTAMSIESPKAASYEIELEACGIFEASITDEQGQPNPCKVAFHGKGDTPTPFFAPDNAAVAVHHQWSRRRSRRCKNTGERRRRVGEDLSSRSIDWRTIAAPAIMTCAPVGLAGGTGQLDA